MWRYALSWLFELFNYTSRKCPICSQNIKEKIEEIRTNLLSLSESKVTWCDICLKEYEETFNSDLIPKVLKCGDTFCIKCIKKIKKNKSGEIDCPICKKRYNENIEEMPINKYIIDLIWKDLIIKNDINYSWWFCWENIYCVLFN